MTTENLINIVIFLVCIVLPFWLILKMDKRTAQKGALFSGQSTKWMKILAALLGVSFAALSILEATSTGRSGITFPLLAFALLAYAAGADKLLVSLQGQRSSTPQTDTQQTSQPVIENLANDELRLIPKNRFTHFLRSFLLVAFASALVVSCAWLASRHPDNPFTWVFIGGLLLFLVVARFLDWFRFLRQFLK
jgi:hypothetical protein